MKTRIKNTLTSILLSLVLLSACKKDDKDDNTPAPSGTVSMKNDVFSPANLTVAVNTTVVWTNNDSWDHTVTSDNGQFNSGHISAGATFSKQFTATGTFPYHCDLHSGMTGTVTVQ